MESFQVECGSCGGILEADESMAGSEVLCPHCEQALKLPTLEELGLAAGEQPEPAGEKETALEEPTEEPPPKPGRKTGKDSEKRGKPPAEEGHAGTGKKRGGTGVKRRPSEPLEQHKSAGSKKGATGMRRKPGSSGGGKSQMKLIALAGGALGLLVLVAIVAFSLMNNPKGGGGNSGGNGEDQKREEEKSRADQYKKKAAEVEGSTNPGDWVDLGDLAAGAGLEDKATAHYRKALELQPDYTAAMKKLGFRKYEIPADLEEFSLEKPLPEELTASSGKWLPPEEIERLKSVEKDFKASVDDDLNKKQNDPFYAAMEQVRSAFLSRKGLDQYEFKIRRSEPFVVFEQTGKKGQGTSENEAISDRKVEEKLRMLQALHQEIKKRLMIPFDLTMDPKLPLTVIALKDRKTWDELHTEMGEPAPENALAYFHRIHTYIILYNDAFGSGGIKAKEFSDGVVFHEGTHQIINAYVRKGLGFNSSEGIQIPFWVNEGLAEYFGGCEITGETDDEGFDVYALCKPHKLRLREFKSARIPRQVRIGKTPINLPPLYFDLNELVECYDQDHIVNIAKGKLEKVKGLPSQLIDLLTGGAVSLVYAQGSSFFLFCYEYKGGKYASACNKYLNNAFHGYFHTKYFHEAFGTKDLSTINKEWLDYIEEVTKSIESGGSGAGDEDEEDDG